MVSSGRSQRVVAVALTAFIAVGNALFLPALASATSSGDADRAGQRTLFADDATPSPDDSQKDDGKRNRDKSNHDDKRANDDQSDDSGDGTGDPAPAADDASAPADNADSAPAADASADTDPPASTDPPATADEAGTGDAAPSGQSAPATDAPSAPDPASAAAEPTAADPSASAPATDATATTAPANAESTPADPVVTADPSAPTPDPTPPAPRDPPASSGEPKVIGTVWIVGSEGAACHATMDVGSPIVADFPENAQVDVVGQTDGDWQPVWCGGQTGYLRASSISWWQPSPDPTATATDSGPTSDATPVAVSDASPTSDSDPGQSVVDDALQYVGYPYVHAAEGPNAFDCSGFTMYIYRQARGLDLTHDMVVQWDMGTKIDRDKLQPGDLVFFQNTIEPGLSHVGIYIGHDQFVHAENEQTGVVVSDLDSDYYAAHWFGAVRYP